MLFMQYLAVTCLFLLFEKKTIFHSNENKSRPFSKGIGTYYFYLRSCKVHTSTVKSYNIFIKTTGKYIHKIAIICDKRKAKFT